MDWQPIDMILHCPNCGLQHIDEPEAVNRQAADESIEWTNPPHCSHLCHNCGHIWRPADVPTNGVKEIKTKGKNDSPINHTDGSTAGLFVQLRLQIQETLKWRQKAQEYREKLILLDKEQQVEWRRRWYGSPPYKGWTIVADREEIAYLGGDESMGAAVDKIIEAHNRSLKK